jgi:5-methyltetrahydrofolate--homocysteine methyltransferase
MIKPPFMGASKVINFSISEIMEHLDLQVLFKSRWKMGNGGEEMLQDLLEDTRFLGSMKPQAIYGYFPVYSEGNTLVVDHSIRWEFPYLKGICLSEFFNSKEEGGDIIPLSAVSVGAAAVELSKELYKNNDYAEYFLMYGLAAECTETIADMINLRIENELGLQNTLRRSFGYPACPDLSYQRALLELLDSQRISLELSESNQLIPEFSTTAFILHASKNK